MGNLKNNKNIFEEFFEKHENNLNNQLPCENLCLNPAYMLLFNEEYGPSYLCFYAYVFQSLFLSY